MWSRTFDPREAARRAVAAAERTAGARLLGACLYGSAVTSEFHPAHSDVNVAFVFSALGPEELESLRAACAAWRRARVLHPLLLAEPTIARSLDTFPLEYLLIRERHEPLHGRDYFDGLPIGREELRLQVERVLRAQELGLSHSYVLLAGSRAGARHWAARAGSAMAASAAGLLWLREGALPASRRALAERCGAVFGADAAAFARLLLLRTEPGRDTEARVLLASALDILHCLLEAAEGLDARRG
ncbi:MAG TPA: hypothetical protein VID50_03580 [Candidatus Eisenbacteria bacterium]|jgi:hypothetical protein